MNYFRAYKVAVYTPQHKKLSSNTLTDTLTKTKPYPVNQFWCWFLFLFCLALHLFCDFLKIRYDSFKMISTQCAPSSSFPCHRDNDRNTSTALLLEKILLRQQAGCKGCSWIKGVIHKSLSEGFCFKKFPIPSFVTRWASFFL